MKQPILTSNLANAAIRAIFLHDRLQPLLTSLKRSVVTMEDKMGPRVKTFAATYLRDALHTDRRAGSAPPLLVTRDRCQIPGTL